MAELLYRLGHGAARRAWIVLTAWAGIIVAAAIAFGFGAGTLSDTVSIPNTPTARTTEQLAADFPEASGGMGNVVISTDDASPFTAGQRERVADLIDRADGVDGVTGVMDPFVTQAAREAQADELAQGRAGAQAQQEQLTQQGASAGELAEATGRLQQIGIGEQLLGLTDGVRQVSEDGSAAIITVSFDRPIEEVPQETKDAVVHIFSDNAIGGIDTEFSAELVQAIPSILGLSEVVGVLVAAVVLLVMLGSLIAAGLPIVNALIGVAVATLGALSLSSVVDMVSITPILGIMLGLAVGIDYSLFIINRHRQQLKSGSGVNESIGLATGTSGNAVVFAGLTVLIALVALNVTGIPFLGLMGTVGAIAVAIAVLVAITLTPAWLGLLGMRVLSRKERAALAGATDSPQPLSTPAKPMSTAMAIGRAVIGVAVLVLVALPAASLRLNLPDGSSEPHNSTQYQAYATIADEFGPGMNGPLLVAADLPGPANEQEATIAQLRIGSQLADVSDVVGVAPFGTSSDGSVLAFQVVPAGGPTSESTEQLVHDLRTLTVDGAESIAVAGQASGNIDISDKLADALPLYLAVVVGLSLVILILVFRSILVPIIATAGFILSYYAALGGVVAIYQWGWLAGVFGVEQPGPILNFLPTIVLGILFGLAMDYMLFLGTGMREAFTHGVPAREAVVRGFRAGRSVVTAAAIIMISVFGGFIFSDSPMIRPIGFALAFGVLVDAFVVRMLIVPALMHLLGRSAWWLPRWLEAILPDVDVEGAKLERHHVHDEPPPAREPATVSAGT